MDVREAGRSGDATCDEFLNQHSVYLDGLLSAAAAERLRGHAASCASCARYDRVVRGGLEVLHGLPEIEPSGDFTARLQHRLFHVRDERALSGTRRVGRGRAALAAAAVLAIVAWVPFLLSSAPGGEASAASGTPPAAAGFAGSAAPAPLLRETVPGPAPLRATAAAPSQLSRPAVSALRSGPPASASLYSLPGPYSPLVVTPPAHRTVRTVSTHYTPFD